MKKFSLVSFCLLVVGILSIVACGGKYDEVIDLNTDFADLVDTYVVDLEKADNAEDMAKVMNTFADGMEKLAPRMKALQEKYPELENQDEQPQAVKDSNKKMENSGKNLAKAMFKTLPYMTDADVVAAQQRIAMAWIQDKK